MFLQLVNTLKVVNIKPCTNESCRCFNRLKRLNQYDHKHYTGRITEEAFINMINVIKNKPISTEIFFLL